VDGEAAPLENGTCNSPRFSLPRRGTTLLSARPAWTKKLRGDLQMHTRWSDGSGTVAEMADAAANRSYEYIAITDHSKTLKIAGGIDEGALKRQGVEIAEVNVALSKSAAQLTVLRSIEIESEPAR